MKLHRSDERPALRDLWARLHDSAAGLHLRLFPEHEPEEQLDDVEDVVKKVLRPVTPAADFRQSLRSSLDRAEHVRREGISVSDPPPYRQVILLGMGATMLILIGMATWLVHRWRACNRVAN